MVLWLEWRWVIFGGFDLVAFPVLGPVLYVFSGLVVGWMVGTIRDCARSSRGSLDISSSPVVLGGRLMARFEEI